jgi:putative aminopeptidase FrvX
MSEETSTIKILLRNFDISGLAAQEDAVKKVISETQKKYPSVKIDYKSELGYLNMKEVLKDHPQLTDYAIEAAKRAGIKAELRPIRGGTDGSRLTARGLPSWRADGSRSPRLEGREVEARLTPRSRKRLRRLTSWARRASARTNEVRTHSSPSSDAHDVSH